MALENLMLYTLLPMNLQSILQLMIFQHYSIMGSFSFSYRQPPQVNLKLAQA
jgi:hypothetical protein